MPFLAGSTLRVALEDGTVFDLPPNSVVLTANGFKRDSLVGQSVKVTGAPITGSGMTVSAVAYYHKVISVTDVAVAQTLTGITVQAGAETLQDPNVPNYAVF